MGVERLPVMAGATVGPDRAGALRVLLEGSAGPASIASGSSRSSASRKTRKSPFVLRMPTLRAPAMPVFSLAHAAHAGIARGDAARRCRVDSSSMTSDLEVRVGLRRARSRSPRRGSAPDRSRESRRRPARRTPRSGRAASDGGREMVAERSAALALEHGRDLELELRWRADHVEGGPETGPAPPRDARGRRRRDRDARRAAAPARTPRRRSRTRPRRRASRRPSAQPSTSTRVGVEHRPRARLVEEAAAQALGQRLGQRDVDYFDECAHCLAATSSSSMPELAGGIYLDLPYATPLVTPAGLRCRVQQGAKPPSTLEAALGGAGTTQAHRRPPRPPRRPAARARSGVRASAPLRPARGKRSQPPPASRPAIEAPGARDG